MRKRIIYIICIIVLFVAGLLLLCKRQEQKVDRIILITIDTLRADHLSCYGYPRRTTPFIDMLAKKGIIFRKALAPMATTSPSHSSIFTSLYPIQHNVLRDGHKLSDEFITLAELLRKMNYQTAGVVSTDCHFKSGNIDQGFEFFNEPELDESKEVYRLADKTIDVAIQCLDKLQGADRFFLWIHLFDPHRPCISPVSFLEHFIEQSEKEKKSFVRFLLDKHHIDFDFYKNNTEHMLININSYDGEILFADTEIRRLYEYYTKKELNSKTLWIITSDHGEGLGNHRWYQHGKHIYNEQLHVPLIFHFSSGSFQGISIDQIVELVDIPPTIIELAGGRLKELPRQVKTVQGTSLVALIEGGLRVFPKKYAFAQRRHYYPKKGPKITLPENINFEYGEKYALQNKTYKYIYRTEGEDEFFNLRKDPYELNNIVDSDTKKARKWRNMLLGKIKRFEEEKGGEPKSVDEETIEKLKSLGYVQ